MSFNTINPGLSGDPDSSSFQSNQDGKYMFNQDTILQLKQNEESEEYKKAASFKVIPNKFFDVSIA